MTQMAHYWSGARPVTRLDVDLGPRLFADDSNKKMFQHRPGATEMVNTDALRRELIDRDFIVDHHLTSIGLAQNKTKQAGIIAIHGHGGGIARRQLR
eukprot:5187803-Pyramimonas_sp.AAC.1